MLWQLQIAKQRFSELVRRAIDDGPQVVTRRGEAVVVVVSAAEFERRSRAQADFKEFLLSAPDIEGLDIRRASDNARVAEL
jgi:prevent-host-death family protein